jgi:predicted DNA-binding transcriptional regulator AlpA
MGLQRDIPFIDLMTMPRQTRAIVEAMDYLSDARQSSPPDASPEQPTTMTAQQLAAYWQVSLRTIRTLNATGKLPIPIRIGKSIRWRSEDIHRLSPPRKRS